MTEVVHELRNLLAPIRNTAQLLRLRAKSDASLGTIADMLDRQTAGIGHVLDKMVNEQRAPEPVNETPGEPTTAHRVHHEAPAGSKAARILIADDNNSQRVSLCNLLEEMGYEVKAVADGVEALATVQEWMPGIVLLDIHMPKLNGIEVARRLRSQFPSTAMKLVMMSGETLSEQTLHAAKLAGFDQCIDKVDGIAAVQQMLERVG